MPPSTLLRRPRRRFFWPAIGALVAGGLVLFALLPPAARPTPPPFADTAVVRGAYHVHSDRSDGSGTVDQIASAAARAGLRFVILTDHGDGTRAPDAPQYRHGVLMIDAVELNTESGHLVALGLPAAPYPFAGTAADVLEDVHRLGGFGIAAHPDSPRPSLQWRDWDAPIDGLEWINADSGWRDEGGAALARAGITYWFRSAESVATLFDRPDNLLARWDAMGRERSVPVLAGSDAHARLGFRQSTDPDVSSFHLPLPGYEAAFRMFSNHLVLERPFTGDGLADAATVLAALKHGRSFTVMDALATPGSLDFTANTSVRTVARLGDVAPLDGDLTLRARVMGPSGTTLRLLRNGTLVQETGEAELSVHAEAGVYRVEAFTPAAPGTPAVPWILSNPIYVGLPRALVMISDHAAPLSRIPARTAEVTTEHGVGDTSALVAADIDADGRDRRFAGEPPVGWQYVLSGGAPSGQFAAVQVPVTGGLTAFDRVRFVVKSERPIRAWVQLRTGAGAERWGRTFFADATTRLVDVPLQSFRPIDTAATGVPPLDRVTSLLIVVDTLNHRPGATGKLTISEVAFVR